MHVTVTRAGRFKERIIPTKPNNVRRYAYPTYCLPNMLRISRLNPMMTNETMVIDTTDHRHSMEYARLKAVRWFAGGSWKKNRKNKREGKKRIINLLEWED